MSDNSGQGGFAAGYAAGFLAAYEAGRAAGVLAAGNRPPGEALPVANTAGNDPSREVSTDLATSNHQGSAPPLDSTREPYAQTLIVNVYEHATKYIDEQRVCKMLAVVIQHRIQAPQVTAVSVRLTYNALSATQKSSLRLKSDKIHVCLKTFCMDWIMAKWHAEFNSRQNLIKHKLLWPDPEYRDLDTADSLTSLAEGITEVMETYSKALAHLIFVENKIEVETSALEWLKKAGVMAGYGRELFHVVMSEQACQALGIEAV